MLILKSWCHWYSKKQGEQKSKTMTEIIAFLEFSTAWWYRRNGEQHFTVSSSDYSCNNDAQSNGRKSYFWRVSASTSFRSPGPSCTQNVGFTASLFIHEHGSFLYDLQQWIEHCKSTSQSHYTPAYYIRTLSELIWTSKGSIFVRRN